MQTRLFLHQIRVSVFKLTVKFDKIAKITGIVLTKYDTSASGGILISIAEKTKLPIVLIIIV